MSHVLDGVPSHLYQEVVYERRICCSTAKWADRRDATSSAVEMSWMQLTSGYFAKDVHLLVREGSRAAATSWSTASLLWPDLWQRTSAEVSSFLRPNVSRRSMSTLYTYGTYADLFLREA